MIARLILIAAVVAAVALFVLWVVTVFFS